MYYTEIRSMHYDKDKKILRITWMSDRCLDEEFLNYAYEYLPELKEKKVKQVYDDNREWLCDWNVGNPKGGAFMITVFFFE